MVSVLVPPGAELAAVSVRVLAPVVEVGENDAVTPLGRPEMERFTLLLNPYSGVTVTVEVAYAP